MRRHRKANPPIFQRQAAACKRCGAQPIAGRGLCGYHYAKLRTHLHAVGAFDSQIVPIGPTIERIRALKAAGIGWPRLSEITGLSRMTLEHVANPGRVAVSVKVEAAILAIQVPTSPFDPNLAEGAKIAATGSRRRLRALLAIGWPRRELYERLGMNPEMLALNKLIAGSQPKVTVARARQIGRLYDELSGKPGPDDRERERARRRGWFPPLAWDDDTIDDPNAQPSGERWHKPHGRRVPADFVDRYLDARDHANRTDRQIAAMMGIQLDALQQRLRRVGIVPQNSPFDDAEAAS